MKIAWLTWKDRTHPAAGGAELLNEHLAARLTAEGHEVIFLVGGYARCTKEESKHGFRIIRLGNRFTVYWQAYRYYRKHLRGWADLVIDEVNTIPFMCKWYVREPNILFVHQLCREIWFYEMFFPLNLIGYLAEAIYLRLLNDRNVITVSKSSKKDLMHFGFQPGNIGIIPEAIELTPVEKLAVIKKYENPTLLSLGTIRPMKQTHHIVQAFELAKKEIPDLQLIVAGQAEGKYGRKVLNMIAKSRYHDDIQYLGGIDTQTKTEILQKSHLLLMTSVKEGWGLTVTEAASQGTLTVGYDADGLRDSIVAASGLIVEKNSPAALAATIVKLLDDAGTYADLAKQALKKSKENNFETTYCEFLTAIQNNA